MAKKITAYIKLQVTAGKANPSPPVGPALGQHGVNIMEFCKAFNARTAEMDSTLKLPVVITVYSDKSFTFITKSPPASALLKKYVLEGKKGSVTPGTATAGKATRSQLEQIAAMKENDLTGIDLNARVRSIAGTARSMGIDCEGVE